MPQAASTRLIFGLLAVNLASTGLSKIFNRRFQFLRLAAEPAYIGLPASSRGAAPDFETGPVCFLTLCRQLVAMLVTLLANIFFPKYSIFCPSYAIIYLPQFTYMRREEVGYLLKGIVTLLGTVIANIISYYICKWLDGDK